MANGSVLKVTEKWRSGPLIFLYNFKFEISPYSTRHFCHDLELRGGDLISSPVDSIASAVSPKKSYGPNSMGKNYFSATPFFTFNKNATGGHNA